MTDDTKKPKRVTKRAPKTPTKPKRRARKTKVNSMELLEGLLNGLKLVMSVPPKAPSSETFCATFMRAANIERTDESHETMHAEMQAIADAMQGDWIPLVEKFIEQYINSVSPQEMLLTFMVYGVYFDRLQAERAKLATWDDAIPPTINDL